MNDSLFEVEVRIPNKIFVINGKPTRSPFKLVVSREEARRIVTSIKALGLLDYTIIEVDHKRRVEVYNMDIKNSKDQEVIKKESKPLDEVISDIKRFSKNKLEEKTLEDLTIKATEVLDRIGNIEE